MYSWKKMLKSTPLLLPKDLPLKIPLLDISGAVLLPKGQLPVTLEKRHAPVIRQAMGTNRLVGVVQNSSDTSRFFCNNLFQTGCLGRISAISESEQGRDLVILTGLTRFEVIECTENGPNMRTINVTYDPFSFDGVEHYERVENRENFLEVVRGYCHLHNIAPNWEEILRSNDDILVTSLAMMCPFSAQEKQALLEVPTLKDREKMMTALMEVACLKGAEQRPQLH